jgi:hypothetical protein
MDLPSNAAMPPPSLASKSNLKSVTPGFQNK